jgi:hypothetical protein
LRCKRKDLEAHNERPLGVKGKILMSKRRDLEEQKEKSSGSKRKNLQEAKGKKILRAKGRS